MDKISISKNRQPKNYNISSLLASSLTKIKSKIVNAHNDDPP